MKLIEHYSLIHSVGLRKILVNETNTYIQLHVM